ncbi:MAG TPA: hypothetical protein VFU19_00285 [Iamia sp.]|nr:hypothetical protein [Iamia sp.]
MSAASFAKRQREKAKKEKAEEKAQRRLERAAAEPEVEVRPPVDEGALLEELAALHARFEDGGLDYEDFAAAKEDITRRLHVG